MNTYIYINDLRIRAHHGVLPQERQVGADFLITLRIKCDMSRSMLSDHVVDTISFKKGSVRGEKTFDGYYILSMGDRTIESSTFMNISNCMAVYEAVKTLVRHKE